MTSGRFYPDPWKDEPPPCKRCNSQGTLVIAMERKIKDQTIKTTEAFRCNCGWASGYRGLPAYDSLREARPTDTHEDLYEQELRLLYGEEVAAKYRTFRATENPREKCRSVILGVKPRRMPEPSKAEKEARLSVTREALGAQAELLKGEEIRSTHGLGNKDLPDRGAPFDDGPIPFLEEKWV